MQPITITRHTTAAAERVWAVATDLENAADTISAIGRVEVLSPPRSASAPDGARLVGS